MAAPEPIVPSRRLRSAAAAERERLSRELRRLDERARLLHRDLEHVDAAREELRGQLALLARLADDADSAFPSSRTTGRAAHLQPVQDTTPSHTVLRGARIRETAVLLLASSANPRRPIHYQQWYELFRNAGYGIEAQDPRATFLTQIGRSPVVRRASAPGVYALDFEAIPKLRQRLRQLESELAAAAGSAVETTEQVVKTRELRANLSAAIRTTERDLEEALRSLASAPTGEQTAHSA